MNTFKIYGKNNCRFCVKAKKLAVDYGVRYEYIDVGYIDGLNELRSLLPEVKTVPQIWYDGKHIGGYNEFATELENTRGGYGEQLF